MPIVYEEFRRQAHRYIKREQKGHSLETSDLINETYLRLLDCSRVNWENRAHFFAVAARMMRRILVDYSRRRSYRKRGGGFKRISLDQNRIPYIGRDPDLVVLDEALNQLAEENDRRSRVVELRFLGGLSIEETAKVLGVCPDTVVRDWRLAKIWLVRHIKKFAMETS